MRRRVAIDTETRGRLDLTIVGGPAYTAGGDFDLLAVGFSVPYDRDAISTPRVRVWSPHVQARSAALQALREVLADDAVDLISANGLEFDAYVLEAVAGRYGLPAPRPARWVHDVAPRSRAVNRPGGLGQMLEALGAEALKASALGARLFRIFAFPDKRNGQFIEPGEAPADFAAFCDDYLVADVLGVVAADRLLPELSAAEQEALLAVADMNRRGLWLDRDLAAGIARIAAEVEHEAGAVFAEATGGLAPGQTVAFRAWLKSRGLDVPGVGADELEPLVATLAENDARRVAIEARLAASASSLKKAAAAIAHPEPARRGEFIYGKARSRRVVANGLQVQNFPRGTLGGADLGELRRLALTGEAAKIRAAGFDPTAVAQQTLRGIVRARPGHSLVVFDFARIEFAVLMHLAGADDLNAADPYRALAAKLHGVSPEDVSKDQRQAAKTIVLGAGYALSPSGYARQTGCGPEEAKAAIGAWRRTFAPAVRLWRDLEDAACAAAMSGAPQRCGARGLLGFEKRGEDLICRLPSGEGLHYPEIAARPGERYGKTSVELSCMTADKGQWVRRAVNLPTLIENAVSSTARDLLRDALVAARLVWAPTMLVHDELVCEVPTELARVAFHDLERVMTTPPAWMPDFRPGAEGFVSDFYRK
jgi:hypothetical protein